MAHQPLHQMTFLQSPSLSVETEKMLKLRFAILKSIKIRYIHRAKRNHYHHRHHIIKKEKYIDRATRMWWMQ